MVLAELIHLFCGYWGFPHSATLLFLILALSFLLSPLWFCQEGHQAEELEKGLKFAVLAVR